MRIYAPEHLTNLTIRGDDTIKLYDWMDKLRDQAEAVGGTVLSHLGNHEWMNVIGDWRYVCGYTHAPGYALGAATAVGSVAVALLAARQKHLHYIVPSVPI